MYTFVKRKHWVSAPALTALILIMDIGINASSPRYQFHNNQTRVVAPAPQKSPIISSEFQAYLLPPYCKASNS